MKTFAEVNRARLALKMKLSAYSWYVGSYVSPAEDGYLIKVAVSYINNQVKANVATQIDGISVRLEQ